RDALRRDTCVLQPRAVHRRRARVMPASYARASRPAQRSTLFPYTTLFRSPGVVGSDGRVKEGERWWSSTTCTPRQVTSTRACTRSEEHTSELQSRENLVCRLLLEKKKTTRQRGHGTSATLSADREAVVVML